MSRKNRDESSLAPERRPGGEVSRWEPWSWSGSGPGAFSMMRRMFDDMDRFFEGFAFPTTTRSRSWMNDRFLPNVDVFERDGKFVISADLPGLSKDDVKVDVTDRAVIIDGERKFDHEEREEGVYRVERGYGQFHREVPLPEGVKTETATADFKNGVLEVTMEAPQIAKSRRRVEIKSGDTGQKAA